VAGTVAYVRGDAIHIGCDFDFGNELDWWDGWLDSVRSYDRALTVAEVATVMVP
jgi:hypothetical protein